MIMQNERRFLMFEAHRFNLVRRFALIALFSSLLLGVGQTAIAGILSAEIKPEVGQSYYLRHNIWVEKERTVSTNYSRGELIPFNSRVTLESVGKKKIVLDIDGRRITVINIKKHSQRDSTTVAGQMLSRNKLSLGGLSRERRDDIESGVLRLGMSKDEVIITRGYPPRHKTASIKANHWVYWSSRFVQRTLVFEKGKLTRGRGLY